MPLFYHSTCINIDFLYSYILINIDLLYICNMKIIKRDIIPVLKKHVFSSEITILSGSRQTGKTTVVKELQKELQSEGYHTFYLTLERTDMRKLLDEKPGNLFSIIPVSPEQKSYVFIDEIQYLENPTNFLKLLYDEYADEIKLIVTGSSAFYIDRKFRDSLAGRKRIFHLTPFSLRETIRYKGEPGLLEYTGNGLKQPKSIPLIYLDTLQSITGEYLLYGGYPRVVTTDDYQEKQLILNELVNSFLKKDAFESNVRKEADFMFFTEVLADRIGNKINRNELSNICGISDETVRNYLYILEKSFHISFVRPFWKSKTGELRKMPKVYFQDNGFRNALLNTFSPVALRKDKGDLLENMVYNLLKKHYPKKQILYWITRDQKEVDFIVNRQFALEVKYNATHIKPGKYKLFQQAYPEIPLQFTCLENAENHIPAWGI